MDYQDIQPASTARRPMELCLRYVGGELDRAELIELLAAYPYAPLYTPDEVDGLTVNPPGSWSEVVSAKRLGLIDASIYSDVFELRQASEAKGPAA